MVDQQRLEGLGPAERVINTAVNFGDHLWHGRPGVVQPNGGDVPKWTFINKQNRDAARQGRIGEYRAPGMFPEAVRHVYKNALEVYQLDAELAARWASFEFARTHRDLKVVLAALMLVQEHAGAPIMEHGDVAFYDDDFREVGEAMLLHYGKGDKTMLRPKDLLRVYDVLCDPEVAEMNRQAGFGRSARNPPIGRYYKTLERWLRFRERNIQLLEGLVNNGYRKTVMTMAQWCGYKPESQRFFEVLRWEQSQKNGHREIGLDYEKESDSWAGLSEEQICTKIFDEHVPLKVATAKIPHGLGLTPAILAACVEGGGMSDKDMIIYTPTLEEFGLLQDADIRARWDQARQNAEDQRARNVAKTLRAQELKEKLEDAADDAARKELAEATKDLDILMLIDISSSMRTALDKAKEVMGKFVQGFPPDQLHAAIFNQAGRMLRFKAHTKAGVEHELSKYRAGGTTNYASGIVALRNGGVEVKEDHDCLVFTIGDQDPDTGFDGQALQFERELQASGYDPIGFCHLPVGNRRGNVMQRVATKMGKPLVEMDVDQFDDVYQIQRTLRNALESAPRIATKHRKSLIEQIMDTDLLVRPY